MYTRVLVKFIHNFFLTLIFSFWLHSSFSWLQYKRNYLCIVQVVKYICVDVMTVIPSLLFSNTLIVSTPSSRSVSVLKRWPWQIVARGTWHVARAWPGLREHAVDHPHVGLGASLPRRGSLRLPRGCQGGERPHEVLMSNSYFVFFGQLPSPLGNP